MTSFNFSAYNCFRHIAASSDVRNGESECHCDKLSYEKGVKDDVNQNPVILSEIYGGKNISRVCDDPKCATPYPSRPSD